jgi:hypothetical protein
MPQQAPPPASPAGPGIAGLPKWNDYTPKLLDETIYNKRIGDEPTIEAAKLERDKMREAYGIPSDPFSEQKEAMNKAEEELKGQKDRNLGTFLMQLGGGLASTPGPFGAALGENLQKHAPELLANDRDLRKEQRDVIREKGAIERADVARKEALMSGDREEYLRKQDRYEKLLDLQQLRIDNNINATNTADLENKKLAYNNDLKIWEVTTEQAGATSRTKMQVDAQREGMMETRKQTVARNMLETIMKPILAGLKAQMVDDETAYAQAFNQALRKLPKEMQETLGYGAQESGTDNTLRFDAKGNPI